MKEFIVKEDTNLNNFFDIYLPYLRGRDIIELYKNKDIKINDKRVNKNTPIYQGDNIKIYVKDDKVEDIKLKTIFEDENIIIIDKPQGLNSEAVYELLNATKECYFIHRLDRNTIGLIVFAKNKTAEKCLLDGFKNKELSKFYLAYVYGKLDKQEDTLKAYLQKDSKKSLVYIFDRSGSERVEIVTKYKVIEEKNDYSLIEIELLTGKTHQIRAHMAFVDHFVIGDEKYGVSEINKQFNKNKQMLISYKIKFNSLKGEIAYLNGKEFLSKQKLEI